MQAYLRGRRASAATAAVGAGVGTIALGSDATKECARRTISRRTPLRSRPFAAPWPG